MAVEWWKYPPPPLFDKWGEVIPVMKRGKRMATVVAIWNKSKGPYTRRYALWSNGELVTQLDAPTLLPEYAGRADVPKSWLPRRRLKMRMKRVNFIKLHRFLVSHGYTDNWRLPASSLEWHLY